MADEAADGLALRTARLDAAVEERIAALVSSGSDEDMYAEQQKAALESLFTDQQAPEAGALALQALRTRFTTQTVTEEGKAPAAQLDELAYSNEIRRQLIAAQPLAETALATLAAERAENARIAILEIDENLQDRVRIAEIRSITKKSDEMIEMKVTLSATK